MAYYSRISLCIGGDFNAKIGKEGKKIEGEEDEEG